jgi:hypothetical protein
MIGGFVLVLAGLAGLALARHAEVEADPVSLPGDIDDTKPPATGETEDMEADGNAIRARTTARARNARDHTR